MRIEYCRNKKNNVVYVYEAESYYDPAKKRCAARRRLIGKLDPVTNEVVPTGKRGRPRNDQRAQTDGMAEKSRNESSPAITEGDTELIKLRNEMNCLNKKVSRMEKFVTKILSAVDEYKSS